MVPCQACDTWDSDLQSSCKFINDKNHNLAEIPIVTTDNFSWANCIIIINGKPITLVEHIKSIANTTKPDLFSDIRWKKNNLIYVLTKKTKVK